MFPTIHAPMTGRTMNVCAIVAVAWCFSLFSAHSPCGEPDWGTIGKTLEKAGQWEEERWSDWTRKNPQAQNKVQRFRFAGFAKMKSPLLVDRGRVLFVQPGGSLTMIDLETGKQIIRRRMRDRHGDELRLSLSAENWQCINNVIIGIEKYGGAFFARRDNAEIFDISYSGSPLIHGDKIVKQEYDGFSVLDTNTLAKKTLWETRCYDKQIRVMGDSFFCVVRDSTGERDRRIQTSVMRCYSADDFSLRWEKLFPTEELVLAVVCDEERILVFVGVSGKEEYIKRCTAILVLDAAGNVLERREAKPEMFAEFLPARPDSDLPQDPKLKKELEQMRARLEERAKGQLEPFYEHHFTFNGVEFQNGRRVPKDAKNVATMRYDVFDYKAIEKAKEEFGAPHGTIAATELPGGGFAWLENKNPGIWSLGLDDRRENGFELQYHRDTTRQWRGRLHTVDDLQQYNGVNRVREGAFSLGGDDRYLVYASYSGRMECLDRATGVSRWIYVFPMEYRQGNIFIPDNRLFWGRFHSDWAALYDDELSTDGIGALQLIGKSAPPSVPVRVDPNPEKRDRANAIVAGVIAWLVPILAMLYLWNRRESGHSNYVKAVYRVLGFTLVDYGLFGGYSRPALAAMCLAIGVAAAFLIWEKRIRIPYDWEKDRKAT